MHGLGEKRLFGNVPVENCVENPFREERRIVEDSFRGNEMGVLRNRSPVRDKPGQNPRVVFISGKLLHEKRLVEQRDVLFVIEEYLEARSVKLFEEHSPVYVNRMMIDRECAIYRIGPEDEFVCYRFGRELEGVLRKYCELHGYGVLDL